MVLATVPDYYSLNPSAADCDEPEGGVAFADEAPPVRHRRVTSIFSTPVTGCEADFEKGSGSYAPLGCARSPAPPDRHRVSEFPMTPCTTSPRLAREDFPDHTWDPSLLAREGRLPIRVPRSGAAAGGFPS